MIDSEALIEKCDSRVEEILDELGIEYKHDNGWIRINCVFHENADGFNLKFRGHRWYCFSQCHDSFTTIDIVMKVLDMTFVEACKWLSSFLGLSSNEFAMDKEKQATREKLKHLKGFKKSKKKIEYIPISNEILNDVEDYHHPYIINRGYSDDVLSHFNVGYCRSGYLESRVVFPIDAPNGTTISLSGRAIEDDVEPRYMIVGDTSKGDTLYGISKISKDDDYIIVVEGFMGVMSLYEWGFYSVVALMGSDITENQLKILLKMARKVIVVLDNDKAGKRGSQKIYNHLYKFLPVVQIKLSDFTDDEKASPCEEDLGADLMLDLTDRLEEEINGTRQDTK